MIETVKSVVNILFPVFAVVLGFLGLMTWKAQLRGESKYNLAADTLREHRNLEEAIRRYRLGAYLRKEDVERYSEILKTTSGGKQDLSTVEEKVELENWSRVVEQFEKYRTCLMRLKISTNNYNIDLVGEQKHSLIDAVINKLDGARGERDFLNASDKYFDQLVPADRQAIMDRRVQIFSVLCRGLDPVDEIETLMDNSFEGINARVRRYL